NAEQLNFIIVAELVQVKGWKVQAGYSVSGLLKGLSQTAHFELDGLTAKPKQKANPSLDIPDGSKVLTLRDLIHNKLKADGLIDDTPPPPDPAHQHGRAGVNPDGKGGMEISSHVMEKINANLAAK